MQSPDNELHSDELPDLIETQTGNIDDLEETIASNRRAVEFTPVGHPDLPSCLNDLADALETRFEWLGNIDDLEEAIASNRRAIELTPGNDPDLPLYLSNLGNVLNSRFERIGNIDDLEHAIASNRQAIELTPVDHSDLPLYLNNLGNALHTRFKRLGNIDDLEEAISSNRQAVELTPDNHPDLQSYLNNLGNGLQTRFEQMGNIDDLEEAISTERRAVELTPVDHPDLPSYFNNLGVVLQIRFERMGNVDDLEEAIAIQSRAVEVTPDNHPDLPSCLNNLGNVLHTRFQRMGSVNDLEEAIASQHRAVELTAVNHPDLPLRLYNLGNVLQTRFEQMGNIDDLEWAIASQRRAVQLTPDDDPNLILHINNLAHGLQTRFEQMGNIDDLEEAISTERRAVQLTPGHHPDLPSYLNNLGATLQYRFKQIGNICDLEEAIANNRQAVQLTSVNHPDLPSRLNNLGDVLVICFNQKHNVLDLEEAIASRYQAVELTPVNSPRLPLLFSNLGHALEIRFNQMGHTDDLERAITNKRQAVQLTPADHPDLVSWLSSLGSVLMTRFKCTGDSCDFDEALNLFCNAALMSSAAPTSRLEAAKKWAMFCKPADFIPPFALSLNLLTELVALNYPIELRYNNLNANSVSDFASEAAAVACTYSQIDLAVEWLEQGRCLVWSQINQLRMSFDEVEYADSVLAQKFYKVSFQLERAGYQKNSQLNDSMAKKISLEEEACQYRRLADEHKSLLEQIRSLPHLDHFLKFHTVSYFLNNLPNNGIVVLINAHKKCCDAVALRKNFDKPLHIPLPKITLDIVKDLQQKVHIHFLYQNLRTQEGQYRAMQMCPQPTIHSVLESLWKLLVKPILSALGFEECPSTLSHIWWCPTGPFAFLPIHAAGIYQSTESCSLLDYAVSSYIPTITTLVNKAKSRSTSSNNILLVSQSQAPDLPVISGVDKETALLNNLMQKHEIDSVCFSGIMATTEQVKNVMASYGSIHLACHGTQVMGKPLESGFHLYDGCLQLSELIKLNLPNADFAFLSACQTSAGDNNLPDEAVHLAAGMLVAGYCSVVATMWPISDDYGQMVAADFYSKLLELGTVDGKARLDGSKAAYALHYAVQCLRAKVGNVSNGFLMWLPYVHFGL